MRLHGHKNKSLIISILLMTVCVQSFSMHFHSAEGDDEHGSHAHVLGSMYADHLTTEHEGEAGPGFLETLVKQLPSLDLFVLVILTLFSISLSKSHVWLGIRKKRPRHYLLFFRPPLRAPPL